VSRAIGEAGPPLEKSYRKPRTPKPLKAVNPERRAKLEERNYGPHAAWVRLQPCVVQSHVHPSLRTSCNGIVQAAHLICRGMGGCKGDKFSLFPACAKHHAEQEGKLAAFQARYDLDLAVLVEAYCIQDIRNLTEEEREAARGRLEVLRAAR